MPRTIVSRSYVTRSIVPRFLSDTNSVLFNAVPGIPESSNTQVTIPAGFQVSTTSWALSFWIRPTLDFDGMGFNACCFAQNDGSGTGRAWVVPYDNVAGHETSIFFNAVFRHMGFTLPLNKWSQIGLIYNYPVNRITCFWDGVEYNSYDTTDGFVIEPADGSFLLGANRFDNFSFDGNMSMVYMWKDVILTSNQMRDVHLSNQIPLDGLHFAMPMNQTSGVVFDVSGNGYHGTFSGGATWDVSTGPMQLRTIV